MRLYLKIFLLLTAFNVFSQNTNPVSPFVKIDSLYREDQFYFGITYNTLPNRPSGISQKKFTPSFSVGFLRDVPINESRTVAIAAGLGYSINNYNQNILVTQNNGIPAYEVITSSVTYSKNKLVLHYVDLPIELRWRTSTPESHKFYRIYSGFKLSYLVYDGSKYVDNQATIKITGNPDFNKLQYGAYVAFGYNTWNFQVYYGLNPIYKTAKIDSQSINMHTLNFGLMFYIL